VHIDQDGDGRIDGRDGFDGENRVEEVSAGAAESFGDFNPHQAELKELRDEAWSELLFRVHLVDVRLNLFVRELLDGCVEERFLFGEFGKWGTVILRHA
jgi:hypothetical protein